MRKTFWTIFIYFDDEKTQLLGEMTFESLSKLLKQFNLSRNTIEARMRTKKPKVYKKHAKLKRIKLRRFYINEDGTDNVKYAVW